MIASKRGLRHHLREAAAAGKGGVLEGDEIEDLRSSAIRRAYDADCAVMKEGLDNVAIGVAWGIILASSTYDPEVIVLGGGVMEEMGEELLPKIYEEFKRYHYSHGRFTPKLEIAELGGDAVAMGAAVIAGEAA